MTGFDREWLAACIIGIWSVARTARLIVYDDFPPMVWLRIRYLALFADDSPWRKLAECPFCLTPYLSAGMLAWAYFSELNTWWWVINGVWAASYFAATIVSYDQPAE